MHATPARPGDRHAEFTGLLGPLLDAAYRMALHLARNPADAEDLLQDAALLAFRHFGQFREGTNFKAWFFRILLNRFYSRYWRRDARVDFDDQVAATPPADGDRQGFFSRIDRPDVQLMGRADADAISAAIGGLPDDFRAVCTLYLVQDLSYKEIAAVLDVPVGTVRSRLHRGRRLLQRSLSGLAVEHGIIHDATDYQERDDAAR
jgi:RNA polymerase sigma-70 factor (ECF subfamily)